jgi:predicted metal-dependent enzyme (double-stranded beta helix superfamily)
MFEKDQFIQDCRQAIVDGQKAIREIVQEAVGNPDGIIRELGEPTEAGVFPLYGDDQVTVINFVWAPHMTLLPHDHKMFAVIGIYSGREDNVFWRRIDGEERSADSPMIEAVGADSLGTGQVATLGRNIVHSVANPIGKLTSAIHVYGGNFFEPPEPRLQWDHESLQEEPWDMNHTHAVFNEARVRYQAGLDAGLQAG